MLPFIELLGGVGMLTATAITRHDFADNFDLVAGMHRLRAKIFKDRLDWDVTISGDMEIDVFDAEEATYLLILTDRREVVGHVRFLPTVGPNMLANTFPELMDGRPAPCSETVIESSRFCVDTSRAEELASNGLRQATFMLFAAMLEWSLAHARHSIATVTDTRMERILRRAGWPLERLGTPRLIGTTQAVAGLLPVSREALVAVRAAGLLDLPVFRLSDRSMKAA